MSQANKSPKKKRGISRVTIPIICVLVAITVALNAAANSTLSGILDAYIGRGEMKIETKAGAENWDTTYYDQDSTNAEDAEERGQHIAPEHCCREECYPAGPQECADGLRRNGIRRRRYEPVRGHR